MNQERRTRRGTDGVWVRRGMMLLAAAVGLVTCDLVAVEPAAAGSGGAVNGAALEAVRRLKGMDLKANPALETAFMRVLEGTRGTPAFVELVRDFGVKGQADGLVEVALAQAEAEGSVAAEAVRLVLEEAGVEGLRRAGAGLDAGKRARWTQAVARVTDARVVPVLVAWVKASGTPVAERAAAIRGLARTEAGARELLRLAGDGGLEEPGRTTAGLALAQSRWPEVRAEAARLLPAPRSADGGELPPVSELVKLRGDAVRGAEVFRSEAAACSKCHRVGDDGVDFGPALSQIGTKLGRQALYEAILDPSSGISFGYEGWEVGMRDGEEVFGILASETGEELVIRQQTGAMVRLRKSDIVRRERQELSVMPAGLAAVMGRQELVDLVEYLTTLRAP